MKFSIVAVVGLALAGAAVSASSANDPQDTPAPAAPALKDAKSKGSYGIGLKIGKDFKARGIELDSELLSKGLKDGLTGGKPLMTDQEIDAIVREMLQAAATKVPEKNKKDGEAFLAANKAKPGVVALPSGLQYKVVKDGTGKVPKATDTVTTHYRGTLIDGTQFDSSYDRGEPTSFPVNGVIPGWTEALQKMKVGSKWQLFIPSDLAYGARGSAPVIGPNSTLVFDIELLGVK